MKRKCLNVIVVLAIGLTILTGCGNTVEQTSGFDQNKEETAAPVENEVSATEEVNNTEPEAEASAETSVPDNTEAPETEIEAEPTEPGELVAEFEPNKDYDKYTLVDYMVEDIAAQFVATVSAKEDGSEYEVHCSVDGEEQIVILDKDLAIISDKTGNMAFDAPIIVQQAIDADNWMTIS